MIEYFSNTILCDLTPGITRRPKPLVKFDNPRVGGRVHAVVRLRRPHQAYP